MAYQDEANEAREKVLREAGRLFSEHGYKTVKLKDIAQALGISQAALYYHVPQGKEQLFVEVMEYIFGQHRHTIEQALAGAAPGLEEQLRAVALGLLAQPPVDLNRLARSDLPALSEANAAKLYRLGDESLVAPFRRVVAAAKKRGEIRSINMEVLATAFLTMVESVHDMEKYKGLSREALLDEVLTLFLNGLRRH